MDLGNTEPTKIMIDLNFYKKIYDTLLNSRQNSMELYCINNNNERVKNMYKGDIDDIKYILERMNDDLKDIGE